MHELINFIVEIADEVCMRYWLDEGDIVLVECVAGGIEITEGKKEHRNLSLEEMTAMYQAESVRLNAYMDHLIEG